MKIVAVTSCPTGIAHTYMAAESLEEAAKEAGHSIAVETQGAAGANPLTDEQIASADVVILAADVEVRNRERFAGKPTVTVPIKRAINDPNAVLGQAAALLAAEPATQTLATATVDRLLHHAHLIVTEGPSLRLAEATEGKGVVPLA